MKHSQMEVLVRDRSLVQQPPTAFTCPNPKSDALVIVAVWEEVVLGFETFIIVEYIASDWIAQKRNHLPRAPGRIAGHQAREP